MKRVTLTVVVLLLAVAAPVFAVNRTVMVVDDVIKMSKAGVADDAIIAFVQKTAEPFEINGDDVIAMNDAHVSSAVIKAVIDESAAKMKSERRDSRRTVYVSPGIYAPYYDPFYYGYYDPFWYGPRVFVGFGYTRFGGFRGGHFRHH